MFFLSMFKKNALAHKILKLNISIVCDPIFRCPIINALIFKNILKKKKKWSVRLSGIVKISQIYINIF